MHKQRRGQHHHGNGRDTAAQEVHARCQRPDALNPERGKCLGLRRAIGHRPQAVLSAGKFRDFGKWLHGYDFTLNDFALKSFRGNRYSKIQCFAAVLSFSRPFSLRASV